LLLDLTGIVLFDRNS